jgi:hypothetical protein
VFDRSLANNHPAEAGSFNDSARPHAFETSGQLKFEPRTARYDAAMRRISRAAGISFVADYFTKPVAMELPPTTENLRAAMKLAASCFNATHRWRGNVMIVRSRDWFAAIDREPRTEVVDRWEEGSKGRSHLDLMDYLVAARELNDRQMATFANHMNEEGIRLFEEEVRLLMRNRHSLRGYASLTGMQKLHTRSKSGLPVSRLDAAQRIAWKPALRILGLFPPEVLARIRIKTKPSQPIPKFSVEGIPQFGEISLVAAGG